MSYLNALRLHFAGQFQANVSTVNNDPAHYDNAQFKASYQTLQGANMRPPNGWFNPQGDGTFKLLGCQVMSAWTAQGMVSASDAVLGCIVADADERVCGKMADLDPEQQLVSEIWGLQMRIANAQGDTLLQGEFEPAAFIDIWDRATGSSGGDTIAGATYQSVLQNLVWGDISASPFLIALQAAATDGLLSIKFNVDGMNLDFTSPDFMCGRVVGTIGPATASEPVHLLIGRQFMAAPGPNPNFFVPLGGLNFFPAVVDTAGGLIYLDLGNAISTNVPGGVMNNLGDLTLNVYDPIMTPGNPAGSLDPIGTIPATGPGGYSSDPTWYGRTAGVVVLPVSAQLLSLIAARPLIMTGGPNIEISEWSSGVFVRADTFVYRLSPDQSTTIPVYAMQWGQPLQGAAISFVLDPSQLQPTPNSWPYVGTGPAVAAPTTAISFNASGVTDSKGVAALSLSTTDPGWPRLFASGDYGIDGQVYGIRASFTNGVEYTGPVNQWNFISVLLWSGFAPPNPVTWTEVGPILQQYANLYPVMSRFLDLGDYDSVVAHAGILTLAFSLDVHDPNSMPVTRDLSPAKRAAILSFLANPVPGKAQAKPEPTHAPAAAGHAVVGRSPLPQGGKAAAAARRLILQHP